MNTDLNRIPISRVGGWYLLVLLSLVSRCVLFSNENDFMASYFASPLVVSVILKKIWCSASTLLCTFVLVFSTKLFTCALRRQIWVFSCTLTFSMRPGCALFRNGPVREVARYPLFSVMHHFQWSPDCISRHVQACLRFHDWLDPIFLQMCGCQGRSYDINQNLSLIHIWRCRRVP